MAAVSAEDHVFLAQLSAHPHRYGFLADVGMAGAGDQTGKLCLRQNLLAAPDHQHLAIQLQKGIRADCLGLLSVGRHTVEIIGSYKQLLESGC